MTDGPLPEESGAVSRLDLPLEYTKLFCSGKRKWASSPEHPEKHISSSLVGNTQRNRIDVTIILPVHNAAAWLDECLESVCQQDFEGSMELSVFNDASKDSSMDVIETWKTRLENRGICIIISGHDSSDPKGVGFAKNQAILQSSGRYLCFLDADDAMMSQRVRLQYEAALHLPANCIIGCQVERKPKDATERYTRWINSLTQEQLHSQNLMSKVEVRLGMLEPTQASTILTYY
ncbi:UDP-GlcNAc:betaGal beta-1,3-N-acetylglucosaminyltransferase-like protein 1 [Protopterus annectens]|uniref:UDP-GlcNAc:betaGal beta-1,3-N-acetylglucosaminyltransferase-like protein 1 n=1 Tax=Protopterus annectens TaxID=7888 RepID=UPI001CFC05E0|nr:UDP-GlcNAc:betaGal beta-1,3-N-acetylglucosaminyltransferase-like protein 1 [Protopterus annectens]